MRSSPIAAIMRSSSLPERPTKGRPSMSSSRPGASPTNITRACGLPSAKTSWVAVVAQRAALEALEDGAQLLEASPRVLAASRAAMTAASVAGGGAHASPASGAGGPRAWRRRAPVGWFAAPASAAGAGCARRGSAAVVREPIRLGVSPPSASHARLLVEGEKFAGGLVAIGSCCNHHAVDSIERA